MTPTNSSVSQLLERYEKGIVVFERAVGTVPTRCFDTSPAPGKWTARQIICHVADCEAVATVRYRMIAAQPGSTLAAFDQEKWANETLYHQQPWDAALRAYSSMRLHNVNMLRGLPLEAWSRSAFHVERGENTLYALVLHNAAHVENHGEQISNLASQWAGASVR